MIKRVSGRTEEETARMAARASAREAGRSFAKGLVPFGRRYQGENGIGPTIAEILDESGLVSATAGGWEWMAWRKVLEPNLRAVGWLAVGDSLDRWTPPVSAKVEK